MNINIRKGRDYSKPLTFKSLWLKEQYQKLRKIYDPTEFSNEELRQLLVSEYEKRRVVQGRFYSNTTQKNEVMSQEQFVDLFLNKPLILSGYAALYENQDNSINIGSSALKTLLDSRKVFKRKMEESEYGSDQYTYYKILQSTYKVLANSYYGILGEHNSVFYNPHVQNSITMSGQDLITTAIMSLESFLADNAPFEDFDDVIHFVNETLEEEYPDQILKYIDEPKDRNDLIARITKKARNGLSSVSTEKLESALKKLDIEKINRLYYKNNLPEFLSNSWAKSKLGELCTFKYKEEPEEAMKAPLKEFTEVILRSCFSNSLFEDRFRRVLKMDRKAVVVSDTDSTFVNIHPYMASATKSLGLDRSNKEQQTTLMNILISMTTKMLESTFDRVTENMGLIGQFKGMISMKNEFVFSRVMLTRNKKSYAGTIRSELGKLLPKPVFDMKGLSIRKSSVAKKLRKQFTEILRDDVLNAEVVNVSKIIKKFDELGIQIEDSLKSGELFYSLPKNMEALDSYKDPSMQEPVRGAIVWNAIETEDQVVPPEKVNMIKMRAFDLNDPKLQALKLSHPNKYSAIAKTVFNDGVASPTIDISRFGLSVISVPKSVDKIPDYLLPMIDLQTMVTNNMTNGYIILESLGVYTEEVKTTKYKSNIIEI
jgi:hypothetical protein